MAAASASDDRTARRRRSSMVEPPLMSVVLLGNSSSQRTEVGNLLLGQTVFTWGDEVHRCQSVMGEWRETQLAVINTPALLHADISEETLREHADECVRLTGPGPHVFLLVLQPETFTEQDSRRLCDVLQLISDRSFGQSLILITTASRVKTSEGMFMTSPPLKDMIRRCGDRYLRQENLGRDQLLTRLSQIVKEEQKEPKPSLNLVLCGRRGAGKTSTAELFLGHVEPQSSSECVKHQGEVCGRQLSLVELPALDGKPPEAVMQESLRSVSLCEPEGVHAFILVLPVGPVTDADNRELKIIQKVFSPKVNDFTMILFTMESDPTAPAVVNFLKETRDIQELCESYGHRSVVLNIRDKQQVSEVLDTVEKMSAAGARCYKMDMFTEVQVKRVAEQENMNKGLIEELEKWTVERGHGGKDLSKEPLRMLLAGRTGSGKSSTANTILGKNLFKIPKVPQTTRTSQKASAEADGRLITVVTTCDLLDSTVSEDVVRRELGKSAGMLSPGPHVFILVLQIEDITPEDKHAVGQIKKYFGPESADFSIIVFTAGDKLEKKGFQTYLEGCDDFVQTLLDDCGGRYLVFNNRDHTDQEQVQRLLTKVQTVVRDNGGSCYRMHEDAQRITHLVEMLKEGTEMAKRNQEDVRRKHEEELDTLRRKHEEDLDTLRRKHEEEQDTLRRKMHAQKEETEKEKRLRIELLRQKDICINKVQEDRQREQVEDKKRWKRQEDKLREDCRRRWEAADRKVAAERERREAAEKNVDQSKKEMRREREAWEKEKKEMWERRCQDLKVNLQEEKSCSEKLREEFLQKRRKYMYAFVGLIALVFLLTVFILLSSPTRLVLDSPHSKHNTD